MVQAIAALQRDRTRARTFTGVCGERTLGIAHAPGVGFAREIEAKGAVSALNGRDAPGERQGFPTRLTDSWWE